MGDGGLVGGGRDLPKSLSALKQARREEMMLEWSRTWRSSTKGRALFAIDSRAPSAAFSKHIHSLPRRHATLLSRLRLNFSDLGATKPFLPLNSAERLCACGAQEKREHYLLECGRYGEGRKRLFEEVKKGGGRFERGSNPSLAVLFHPHFTFPLLRFIHSTGRFSSLFSLVIPPSSRDAP